MADSAFQCQMCGQCCQGKGGIVLSRADLERLASYLHIDNASLANKYVDAAGGKPRIRQGADGCCIFFDSNKGCSIHTAKPDVCRAWPYFRGNLEDGASLAMAREYCPGIARDITFQQFAAAGLKWLEQEQLVFESGPDTPNALVNAHLVRAHKGASS